MLKKLLAACLLVFCACGTHNALAQTPSPLQEWQYPGGIVLQKLFEPKLPEWTVILGLAASGQPAYSGATRFRGAEGPVINIRYRGRLFVSSGQGVGVNFIETRHYRASLAVGLDLGRRMAARYSALHGLGDIPRAPFVKLATSYVISKRLPVVLRADIRKIAGGSAGFVGDLDIYTPLPGSSRRFIMFAGPTVTFADRTHLQTVYGVSERQAALSGKPAFATHGGLEAAGIGFSVTRFLTPHWLINGELAASWLLGSAARSPIVERKTQGTLSLSFAYLW